MDSYCYDLTDPCRGNPCGNDGECSEESIAGKRGFICDCRQGFAFDGSTCKDVDECNGGDV